MVVKINLMKAAAIGSLCDRAIKASGDADKLIHEANVQALLHYEKTGDDVFILRLVNGLKGTANGAWVRKWFTDNSNITTFRAQDNGEYKLTADKTADRISEEQRGTMSTAFNETEAAQNDSKRELRVWSRKTLETSFKTLNDRFEEHVKAGKFDGDPDVYRAALKSAVNAFERAIKPQPVPTAEKVADGGSQHATEVEVPAKRTRRAAA